MITLAIDQSTPFGSLALLDDDALRAERRWESARFRGQEVFAVLPGLLAEADVRPEAIDLFAVGLGPGMFSGLRVALAAARALALPGERPVQGVSSGEALADELLREGAGAPVAVVGDARRERLWFAVFDAGPDGPLARSGYELAGAAELPARLPPGATVVSPEAERLPVALADLAHAGFRCVAEPRRPAASTVGRLVRRHRAAGRPAPPLEPIYIHPPVFVAPRFA